MKAFLKTVTPLNVLGWGIALIVITLICMRVFSIPKTPDAFIHQLIKTTIIVVVGNILWKYYSGWKLWVFSLILAGLVSLVSCTDEGQKVYLTTVNYIYENGDTIPFRMYTFADPVVHDTIVLSVKERSLYETRIPQEYVNRNGMPIKSYVVSSIPTDKTSSAVIGQFIRQKPHKSMPTYERTIFKDSLYEEPPTRRNKIIQNAID